MTVLANPANASPVNASASGGASQQITPLGPRRSVGADIGAQLQQLIQQGQWLPGARLPSQRQLAAQFGASLSSVREAMSVLVASGLLEARPGRGTLVRGLGEGGGHFDGWLGQPGSTAETNDLLEMRRLLEHYSLRQAALRRAVGQLPQCLAAMAACGPDLLALAQADLAFHLELAACSGNSVAVRLMRALQAPLGLHLQASLAHLAAAELLAQNHRDHELMVAAIAAGEPQSAVEHFDAMLARIGAL
jgi:GntR family transcriptional regulator, transcriptional repressor for pyruvate dehydrogenase complex